MKDRSASATPLSDRRVTSAPSEVIVAKNVSQLRKQLSLAGRGQTLAFRLAPGHHELQGAALELAEGVEVVLSAVNAPSRCTCAPSELNFTFGDTPPCRLPCPVLDAGWASAAWKLAPGSKLRLHNVIVANGTGGCFWVGSNATARLEGVHVRGCRTVNDVARDPAQLLSGGIHVAPRGMLVVMRSSITDTAVETPSPHPALGGAIGVYDGGSLIMEDSMTSSTAVYSQGSHAFGGALYLQEANATITNVHLHSGMASTELGQSAGGGIYAKGGMIEVAEDSIITNATARPLRHPLTGLKNNGWAVHVEGKAKATFRGVWLPKSAEYSWGTCGGVISTRSVDMKMTKVTEFSGGYPFDPAFQEHTASAFKSWIGSAAVVALTLLFWRYAWPSQSAATTAATKATRRQRPRNASKKKIDATGASHAAAGDAPADAGPSVTTSAVVTPSVCARLCGRARSWWSEACHAVHQRLLSRGGPAVDPEGIAYRDAYLPHLATLFARSVAWQAMTRLADDELAVHQIASPLTATVAIWGLSPIAIQSTSPHSPQPHRLLCG